MKSQKKLLIEAIAINQEYSELFDSGEVEKATQLWNDKIAPVLHRLEMTGVNVESNPEGIFIG